MKTQFPLVLVLIVGTLVNSGDFRTTRAEPKVHAKASVQTQRTNRYEAAGIEDPSAVPRFLRALQVAVAKKHRAKVASMVDYPVTVTIAKRKKKIKTSKELIRHYRAIFNAKVKRAIARQKVEKLFVNQQGVMIGRGEIWFNQQPTGKALKIIAINN